MTDIEAIKAYAEAAGHPIASVVVEDKTPALRTMQTIFLSGGSDYVEFSPDHLTDAEVLFSTIKVERRRVKNSLHKL